MKEHETLEQDIWVEGRGLKLVLLEPEGGVLTTCLKCDISLLMCIIVDR